MVIVVPVSWGAIQRYFIANLNYSRPRNTQRFRLIHILDHTLEVNRHRLAIINNGVPGYTDHRRVIFLGVLVPNGFIHGFTNKGQRLREITAQHVLVVVPHKAEQVPGGQHRLAGVGVRSQQPGRVYQCRPLGDHDFRDFGNLCLLLRRRIALLGMLVLLQSADQGFRFAFGIAVLAVDMAFRLVAAQNPLAGDIARIHMYVAFLIGGARQDRLARDIAVLAVDMALLHAADQIAYRFIALLRVGVRFFAADQLTPICRQIIQLRRHRSGWQQADTHHQGKEQGESALAKGLKILHAINSSFLCRLVRMQSIRRPGCHSFSAVGPIALRPVISGGLLILQPGWPGACAR